MHMSDKDKKLEDGPFINKVGEYWVAEDAQGNELGRNKNMTQLKRELGIA